MKRLCGPCWGHRAYKFYAENIYRTRTIYRFRAPRNPSSGPLVLQRFNGANKNLHRIKINILIVARDTTHPNSAYTYRPVKSVQVRFEWKNETEINEKERKNVNNPVEFCKLSKKNANNWVLKRRKEWNGSTHLKASTHSRIYIMNSNICAGNVYGRGEANEVCVLWWWIPHSATQYFGKCSSFVCMFFCQRRFGIIIYTFANVHACVWASVCVLCLLRTVRHTNAEPKHLQCDFSYLFSLHSNSPSNERTNQRKNDNPDLQLIFTIILHLKKCCFSVECSRSSLASLLLCMRTNIATEKCI